jgi:hypothetical protein
MPNAVVLQKAATRDATVNVGIIVQDVHRIQLVDRKRAYVFFVFLCDTRHRRRGGFAPDRWQLLYCGESYHRSTTL